MRVAITGGRDREPSREEMNQFWLVWMELHAEAASTGRGEPVLVHGDCRGTWPAAGPRRNRRMLTSVVKGQRVEALIQFLGGTGTADCMMQARVLKIPVYPVF